MADVITKTRSEVVADRLGQCAEEFCTDAAVCANCVRCEKHHRHLQDDFVLPQCGFDMPKEVNLDNSKVLFVEDADA